MRLEKFSAIFELDLKQQQRFLDKLIEFSDNEEIIYGIEQSLALLGYRIIY